MFIVFKHYMTHFKENVGDFGQAMTVRPLTALLQCHLVVLAISSLYRTKTKIYQ